MQKDQVLIFYSNSSDRRLMNRYNIIALSESIKAGKPIEVFTINIDKVTLDAVDVDTYQVGNEVISCTTINDGAVMEKQVNPFESTFHVMVRNILIF